MQLAVGTTGSWGLRTSETDRNGRKSEGKRSWAQWTTNPEHLEISSYTQRLYYGVVGSRDRGDVLHTPGIYLQPPGKPVSARPARTDLPIFCSLGWCIR